MKLIILYQEADNNKRENFWLAFGGLICLMILIIFPFFEEAGSRIYYKSHNGLFIINIIIFFLFIGSKGSIQYFWNRFTDLFRKKTPLTLEKITSFLLFITFILSVFSFLFILDLSFIQNYGVRISAVVAVTFAKLIKDYLTGWRK